MTKNMRVHIVVSGRVQGVFFRAGAQQQARELGLGGWARNLVDGRVEFVCEGEKDAVEQFVEWCKQGPPGAKVAQCDVAYEETKGGFDDFSILP